MIETKKIKIEGYHQSDKVQRKAYAECKKYIQDLTSFGWQIGQETKEGHVRMKRHYQTMSRDTTISNYRDYKKLEQEYESAKSQIKTYEKVDPSILLVLFLLLIIPGVIYLIFKSNQKNEINTNNNKCYEKMRKAVDEAKKLK